MDYREAAAQYQKTEDENSGRRFCRVFGSR